MIRFIILLFFIPSIALSKQFEVSCETIGNDVSVVMISGFGTVSDDYSNLASLKKLNPIEGAHYDSFQYDSIVKLDGYEAVYFQMVDQLGISTAIVANGVIASAIHLVRNIPGIVNEGLIQTYDNVKQKIRSLEKPIVDSLKVFIDKKAQEGKPVVFVAHSQANLYFAQAIGNNKLPENISIVHVGSPSSLKYGAIVNKRDDVVVQATSVFDFLSPFEFFNSILSGNNYHYFEESYMDENMRPALVDAIKKEYSKLAKNKDEKKVLTVSLSWDDERDLDLHVVEQYEGISNRVYHWGKGNFLGEFSGDRKTIGKEVYTLKCKNLRKQLNLGIATNTTIVNSNSIDSAIGLADLIITVDGNKIDRKIIPGWSFNFERYPHTFINFSYNEKTKEYQHVIPSHSQVFSL